MSVPERTRTEQIVDLIQEAPGFYLADNTLDDYELRLRHLLQTKLALDAEVRMCREAILRIEVLGF